MEYNTRSWYTLNFVDTFCAYKSIQSGLQGHWPCLISQLPVDNRDQSLVNQLLLTGVRYLWITLIWSVAILCPDLWIPTEWTVNSFLIWPPGLGKRFGVAKLYLLNPLRPHHKNFITIRPWLKNYSLKNSKNLKQHFLKYLRLKSLVVECF